ncbi:anti-sigma factor [Solwaraspora sp. WMMD791]|uniref:anti-sigma factor n=1 Tax=Solwaraspora sp. WMMD791 TaxID=3016086 RepID=UPI00249C4D2D|nr:anti-sigma factor [Solwaraspora sp. WMMD791]WFE27202.1 anti-sigma factor [Solwaraspora sp. WMMD791]
MPHLEHDRLVFLALGETEADAGESGHLSDCPRCRTELETIRYVGQIGAEAQDLADLPEPADHVWRRIVAELDGPATGRDPATSEVHESPAGPTPAPAAAPAPAPAPAPVVPLRTGRRSRRWPRRWLPVVTAIAAAIAGVVGTVAVVRLASPPPAGSDVVASAALAAFGDAPADAAGEARVFDDGRLHLHVAGLPRPAGYYQVWLIDPDTMQMFPVGTLADAADVLMPLPTNVDLDAYRLVDVSAEEYDNDPSHSGQSLLRGTLSG